MSSYLIQFPLVCKCNCLCMFSLLCFLIRFHCSKMIWHSMFWILVEDKRIWRKGEKNKPCQTLRCRDVAMDMDVKEGRKKNTMDEFKDLFCENSYFILFFQATVLMHFCTRLSFILLLVNFINIYIYYLCLLIILFKWLQTSCFMGDLSSSNFFLSWTFNLPYEKKSHYYQAIYADWIFIFYLAKPP